MAGYNNGMYPFLFVQPQQGQVQQNQGVPMQQYQSAGLLPVPVPNEEVARNYPVGFGQSVLFKDENQPFIYTKAMGFSQLESPKFEKYRLIKEETEEDKTAKELNNEQVKEIEKLIGELRKEIEDITAKVEDLKSDHIETIRKEIEQIKNDLSKPIGSFSTKKKKEVTVDDESDT